MSDLFRETSAGRIIRFISRRKLLLCPEELAGFQFQYPAVQSPRKAILEIEKESLDAADIPDLDFSRSGISEPERDSSSATDPATPKDEFVSVDW